MKTIKKLSFTLASILTIFTIGTASLGLTVPTYAADSYNICSSNATDEVKRANGCDGSAKDGLPNAITNIVNSVIGAIGIVAVIFIVVGGVNYMASSGDATKVKKAKDTILYATIGLVICALAFAIVNFVIKSILNQ